MANNGKRRATRQICGCGWVYAAPSGLGVRFWKTKPDELQRSI